MSRTYRLTIVSILYDRNQTICIQFQITIGVNFEDRIGYCPQNLLIEIILNNNNKKIQHFKFHIIFSLYPAINSYLHLIQHERDNPTSSAVYHDFC